MSGDEFPRIRGVVRHRLSSEHYAQASECEAKNRSTADRPYFPKESDHGPEGIVILPGDAPKYPREVGVPFVGLLSAVVLQLLPEIPVIQPCDEKVEGDSNQRPLQRVHFYIQSVEVRERGTSSLRY